MIVDCDRHVAFDDFRDLFPHMSLSWQKRFDRREFLGSIVDTSRHVWADDRYSHPDPAPRESEQDEVALLLPHQGLTVNGWADPVTSAAFLEAMNSYGEEHWSAPGSRRTVVVSPYDPQWSANEVRRCASAGAAAVAIPLAGPQLGSSYYDPIYDACQETGLPVVVHFSGLEGYYRGAQPLAGGVHWSAFSRHVLLPQLAESNLASMTFEGSFEKFPELRMLVSGFGFTWLPPLLWRLDREWATFRHDIPWVKRRPSEYLKEQAWFASWPLAEAGPDVWERFGFTDEVRARIVYGSHDPFDGDTPDDIRQVLGGEADSLLAAGAALLAPVTSDVT
jgi:predicted TIM-barrel fold metal-dependent hydrolase